MTTAGWRLLLVVLLALAVGFFAGARYAEAHRYVPHVQPGERFAYDTLGPTHLVGLHDYAVPRRFVVGPAAAPGSAPAASPGVLVRDTAAKVSGGQGRHRLSGRASWHATGRSGLYAAACAPLRRVMGSGWRGRYVLVAYGRRAVEVRLNDLCRSTTKLIDLSDEAFRYFAPLSRGTLKVTVEW